MVGEVKNFSHPFLRTIEIHSFSQRRQTTPILTAIMLPTIRRVNG